MTNLKLNFRIIFFLVLLFFNSRLFGQYFNIVPAPTSIASTATAHSQQWTSFNTPATLAYMERVQIGVQYDNRFGLSQLATKSAQLTIPTKLMNVGASMTYFGYSLYHEMAVGATLARNFGDVFAIGLQTNYINTYFSNSNAHRGALFIQVGVNTKLTPKFSLGFHAFNPTQINIKTEYSEKIIPTLFSLGTGYLITPQCNWRTQVDKEIHSAYRVATALDYQLVKELQIKIGAYASDYLVPCFGVNLCISQLTIHLNTELHPLLGVNSFVGLKYDFHNRE